MLPPIVTLLRDLGVRTEWLVIGADEPGFFVLTKHLHNLVHGVGTPQLDESARALFERVNRANAEALRPRLRAGDVLVVHDPQPLPLGAMLRGAVPLVAIWRSHIGLDTENAATRAAWDFLGPYLGAYDHAVFSAPEYIPQRLAGRATVIPPGIDPLAPKNMELSLRHTVEILCNGGLAVPPGPMLHPPFAAQARRLLADGAFGMANAMEDIGLLTRPIVTQISRWDRLKGWIPLLQAFAALKQSALDGSGDASPRHRRRLELVRLVLAGPEPAAIQDDPEGREVLDELRAAYAGLPPAVQDDIALVAPRERAAAGVHAGGPELAARGLRPDDRRGDVEARAGAEQRAGLRAAPAGARRAGRAPDRRPGGRGRAARRTGRGARRLRGPAPLGPERTASRARVLHGHHAVAAVGAALRRPAAAPQAGRRGGRSDVSWRHAGLTTRRPSRTQRRVGVIEPERQREVA
jgi:hypothetical protein